MSRRSNTKDCRKSLIIMVTMQFRRSDDDWWMKNYLFEILTTGNRPDIILSLAKFVLVISLRDHRHRNPVFSLSNTSSTFSLVNEDHVIVFILLRCLPLNSAFVFFEKKTVLSSGFLLLFWFIYQKDLLNFTSI